MPANNSTGASSLGRDVQVVVLHPLAPGGRIDIPNPTEFDGKPNTTKIKSKRLDGRTFNAAVIDDWTVTIGADRGSSGLDDLANLYQAVFIAGGPLQPCQIFSYITNPDGSQSRHQYVDAAPDFAELGNYKGDDIVKQRMTFSAAQRLSV